MTISLIPITNNNLNYTLFTSAYFFKDNEITLYFQMHINDNMQIILLPLDLKPLLQLLAQNTPLAFFKPIEDQILNDLLEDIIWIIP